MLLEPSYMQYICIYNFNSFENNDTESDTFNYANPLAEKKSLLEKDNQNPMKNV